MAPPFLFGPFKMWVRQTYEFARKDTPTTGIFAGVTLKFESKHGDALKFCDEWDRSGYGLSDKILKLAETYLNERNARRLVVTLVDFRFSDVDLTDEAVEIAVRGCITAAVEHFPKDVLRQ